MIKKLVKEIKRIKKEKISYYELSRLANILGIDVRAFRPIGEPIKTKYGEFISSYECNAGISDIFTGIITNRILESANILDWQKDFLIEYFERSKVCRFLEKYSNNINPNDKEIIYPDLITLYDYRATEAEHVNYQDAQNIVIENIKEEESREIFNKLLRLDSRFDDLSLFLSKEWLYDYEGLIWYFDERVYTITEKFEEQLEDMNENNRQRMETI